MKKSPLLDVVDIRKYFGGIRAVDGCTLSVEPETITGLIGPNGAGKTTLFDVVVGLYEPNGGSIYFNGDRIDRLLPHEIVRKGIVKTFQIPRELGNLTVLDNLMVAAPARYATSPFLSALGLRKVWAEERGLVNRAEDILSFMELDRLSDEFAKNLSGGQKKILELARALMAGPDLVLLDEPVAGINPTLTAKLLKAIQDLRSDQGKTFFLVEHDMDVVFSQCDTVIVMHQGKRLAEGKPESIRTNPEVISSYLGG